MFQRKCPPIIQNVKTVSIKNRFSVTRRDFNVLGKPLVGFFQLEVLEIEGTVQPFD
jgi:hypothetical protein